MIKNKLDKVIKSGFWQRIILAVIGIIINVSLSYLMYRLGFPFYLDCIGTICISAVVGLFPGILTAVGTNACLVFFNANSIYFGFLNAIIAIFTSFCVRKDYKKSIRNVAMFILIISLVSGVISTYVSWFVLEGVQIARNAAMVLLMTSSFGIPMFFSYLIYMIFVNIIDKGVTVMFAFFIMHFISDEEIESFKRDSWKQSPLSDNDLIELNKWGRGVKHSMQRRATAMIILTSTLLVVVTAVSGIRLYFKKHKENLTIEAFNSLHLIVKLIDADDIRSIMINGDKDPAYQETEKMIRDIVDSYEFVEEVYLVKFGEKEGRIIMDVPSSYTDDFERKTIVEYDEQLSEHLSELLKGESVIPLEHGNMLNWTRSIFYPISDNGNLICYAVADVSMTYLADYMQNFSMRFLLVFLGFFILVISNNMWFTNCYMAYPVKTVAKCVDDFSHLGYEQEQLDNNVKTIRSLDIRTGDEVEKLYDSICNMTLNIANQMRDLRKLSDATLKMQDGLIITMADMVENRDSDTGEHIQKTALYVKIVVEGLKKKGYYASKITPKFMSDVVRSAPLHDIGKIHIPDGILNKPGKLTDEEFEIMKTHTTAGKKIMEDAISSIEGENYLKEARNMAAYHHERWDGKGYPEGLHGEVIPLSARIMAVADVFDALTSPRVYKPAFPIEKAISIITEESGKQFDPKCVEVFLEAMPEVKDVLNKYNSK